MSGSVLIIEDSRSLAQMLTRAVKNEFGVAPHVARTFQEAKRLLKEEGQGFFVAIVDLNLPDASDGEAVTLTLKFKVPTIVLTGSHNKAVRDKVLQMDILDYMVKGGRVIEQIIAAMRRLALNRKVRILLVDDAAITRRLIKGMLSCHGYMVLEATNGEQALQMLQQEDGIKLLITDFFMPGLDGFDLISKVRQQYTIDELSIIGLSASEAEGMTAQFLKMGANDFLYKDFSEEEFICRVRQNVALVERFEEIKDTSNRDYLTGLYNRRYFFGEGRNVVELCKRSESPMALAMMDIDYFKQINDTFGHEAGDEALRRFGAFLIENSRRSDIVARFGGEEFCFLACNMNKASMPLFFRRLCHATSQIRVQLDDDTSFNFSLSIGVTHVEGTDLEAAIKRADDLLYRAKQMGRNQVVLG